jgi:hypothetical protein
VTQRLAVRHGVRESAREQAEWILAYFARQLRDASLTSVSGAAGVFVPAGSASLLRLEGGATVDCLGMLVEKTMIRKRFYLVASEEGLFDLRCSQQGGGDGTWTLASGLHGLSLVLAVDVDADGVADTHLSPRSLAAGVLPMMATLGVPVQPHGPADASDKPGNKVHPAPEWWAGGDAVLQGRPEDFEWMITSVRLR